MEPNIAFLALITDIFSVNDRSYIVLHCQQPPKDKPAEVVAEQCQAI